MLVPSPVQIVQNNKVPSHLNAIFSKGQELLSLTAQEGFFGSSETKVPLSAACPPWQSGHTLGTYGRR